MPRPPPKSKPAKIAQPHRWDDHYTPPRTLAFAVRRIERALRELVGGSPHRGFSILETGKTPLVGHPFKTDLYRKAKPPPHAISYVKPKHLRAAKGRIEDALKALFEGRDGVLRTMIFVLTHKKIVPEKHSVPERPGTAGMRRRKH